MNSKHDSVNGRLFYDPTAEAEAEADRGNSNPTQELAGPATTLREPERKTSEEIHRTLFSAQ